jgi:hypothetical protein
MPNSTRSARPQKPYRDFPLFAHVAHRSAHWAKKIQGKWHYFGRWGRWGRRPIGRPAPLPDSGCQTALDLYKAQADDSHAARLPRPAVDGAPTIGGTVWANMAPIRMSRRTMRQLRRR